MSCWGSLLPTPGGHPRALACLENACSELYRQPEKFHSKRHRCQPWGGELRHEEITSFLGLPQPFKADWRKKTVAQDVS